MSKEEKFWNWFRENNSKYYFLNQMPKEEKEKSLDDFLEQLHEYCDKLFFQIGGFHNGPQELIISAEGDKDYFDKVEDLVSQAPKINDWKIIAFKPPMGVDFITDYENIKLNPKKIWFLPLDNENDPNALGLKIHIDNYDPKQENLFLSGTFQVLDTLLGEKSAGLDIQHIEVGKLPKNPEKKGLIELIELPKYIKWRKTQV